MLHAMINSQCWDIDDRKMIIMPMEKHKRESYKNYSNITERYQYFVQLVLLRIRKIQTRKGK